MFAALEKLIPHRAPMQWIQALTGCDEKMAAATARFAENDFCVAAGRVLETALVECIAQTVAAALGQRAQTGGGQPGAAANGMLMAVANFKIISRPPVEKTLLIEIKETRRLGPMLMVEGKISCGEAVVATGDLSLYA